MSNEMIPAEDEITAAYDRIEELECDLERALMRLVACDVVAMADTQDSAKEVRKMHPDYESAACESVKRRVDECIALRVERDALLVDNTHLRDRVGTLKATLTVVQGFLNRITHWQEGTPDLHDIKELVKGALK